MNGNFNAFISLKPYPFYMAYITRYFKMRAQIRKCRYVKMLRATILFFLNIYGQLF